MWSRIIVKNKWLELFDTFLANDRYTSAIVRHLFFNHLISFFSSEQVILPIFIPEKIQQAMNDQQEIGWKQLVFGRLAYKWGNIIADHLLAQKVDNKEMTPLVWGRRITRFLFEVGLKHWQQRNSDGHLLTQHKDSTLTRNRLLQRVEFFQSVDHDIQHPHRDFIYRDFEILEGYTNGNLRSWLKMAETLTRASKKRRRTNENISQYWRSLPNVSNSVGGTNGSTALVPGRNSTVREVNFVGGTGGSTSTVSGYNSMVRDLNSGQGTNGSTVPGSICMESGL
jgi:hypothetical protein